MKITQIRNATLIIEFGEQKILVDPMLAAKATLPKLRYFRSDQRNPLVDLPAHFHQQQADITAALITHCQKGHFDHLDRAGVRWLVAHQVPTYCTPRDAAYLSKKRIATAALTHTCSPFFGGTITRIPATHTRGWLTPFMEHGTGYFIQLPHQPSLYLMGDTVLTDTIRQFIHHAQPDYIVAPTGKAQFDVGAPLLLDEKEIIELATLSQGIIIGNHMEALDHCRISRSTLANLLRQHQLSQRFFIPADGETLDLLPQGVITSPQ